MTCTWSYLLHFPSSLLICCRSSSISTHLLKTSRTLKFAFQVLGVLSSLCLKLKEPSWMMMASSRFPVISTVQMCFGKKRGFFLGHKQTYGTHPQLIWCYRQLRSWFLSCTQLLLQLCGRVWQLHGIRFIRLLFFSWGWWQAFFVVNRWTLQETLSK